ncbi:MAG: hypothetical protein N2047_05720 [Meiothermus sp.]|nr:hypothetical protein [Meiothermus sp.]
MFRVQYTLTSYCLLNGRLTLTRSLQHGLKEHPEIALEDTEGERFSLRPENGFLLGLQAFYEKWRCKPNDRLHLFWENQTLYVEVEPVETRAAPPRVQSSPSLPPTPPPRPAFSRLLEPLGFRLYSTEAPWRFHSHLGRSQLRLALARIGESSPSRLQEAHQAGARVLLIGSESEIPQLQAAVSELHQQTLGRWARWATLEALERFAALARQGLVGPFDLEELLRQGDLGLDRLKQVASLTRGLDEMGHLTRVLALLQQQPLHAVFWLQDLLVAGSEMGLTAAEVQAHLEMLSRPPFLLVRRLSPGEYLLLRSVPESLRAVETYARMLAERFGGASPLEVSPTLPVAMP